MLGVGVRIGHVRCHMTLKRIKVDHVIRHMTYLRASEDYTSRRNLESSKIRHMISKTFRDEKRIATKSTIAKEVLSEGSYTRSKESIQ